MLAGNAYASKTISGTFASTSPHLSFLSEWFDIDHAPGWTCTSYRIDTTANQEAGIKTLVSSPDWMPSFEHDGETYTLYKTGTDGVGYILRQEPDIPGSQTLQETRRALTINNADGDTLHKFTFKKKNKTTYQVSIKNQARLVKWNPDGNFPDTDFNVSMFAAAEFSYWTKTHVPKPKHVNPVPEDVATRPHRFSRISATLVRTDNTCDTPASQTVILPSVPKSEFTSTNPTAGNTVFDLALTNCSPNIKSILYKLLGSNGNTTDDNQSGRLALDQQSTASGVKVQVRDQAGNPIKFSNTILYAVHDHQQGNLTANIRLQARYIQTANTITAGSVHATMTVAYQYQ